MSSGKSAGAVWCSGMGVAPCKEFAPCKGVVRLDVSTPGSERLSVASVVSTGFVDPVVSRAAVADRPNPSKGSGDSNSIGVVEGAFRADMVAESIGPLSRKRSALIDGVPFPRLGGCLGVDGSFFPRPMRFSQLTGIPQ